MSEKQVNGNSQNQNFSGVGGVEPQPLSGQKPQMGTEQAQAVPSKAQAESASQVNVSPAQAKPEMQFSSAEIGVRKAQEAAENQQKQNAEKRKRDLRKRQIVIIVGVVIAVVLIAVVIWALFGRKPQGNDDNGENIVESTETLGGVVTESTRLLAKAREISENGGDLEEVETFFADALADADSDELRAEILLAQVAYYYNNWMNDAALALAETIDDEKLEIGSRSVLYNMMSLIYQKRGDEKLANEYDAKGYRIMLELQGTTGGEDE